MVFFVAWVTPSWISHGKWDIWLREIYFLSIEWPAIVHFGVALAFQYIAGKKSLHIRSCLFLYRSEATHEDDIMLLFLVPLSKFVNFTNKRIFWWCSRCLAESCSCNCCSVKMPVIAGRSQTILHLFIDSLVPDFRLYHQYISFQSYIPVAVCGFGMCCCQSFVCSLYWLENEGKMYADNVHLKNKQNLV